LTIEAPGPFSTAKIGQSFASNSISRCNTCTKSLKAAAGSITVLGLAPASPVIVRRLGSDSSSAREQLDDQQYHRDDQNQVNQSTRNVETEPEEPENDEDHYEGIKHNAGTVFLVSLLVASMRGNLFSAENRVAHNPPARFLRRGAVRTWRKVLFVRRG